MPVRMSPSWCWANGRQSFYKQGRHKRMLSGQLSNQQWTWWQYRLQMQREQPICYNIWNLDAIRVTWTGTPRNMSSWLGSTRLFATYKLNRIGSKVWCVSKRYEIASLKSLPKKKFEITGAITLSSPIRINPSAMRKVSAYARRGSWSRPYGFANQSIFGITLSFARAWKTFGADTEMKLLSF